MSVFSKAESGTSFRGNRFPRIVDRTILDCDYGCGYPVFGRFVVAGDIWRVQANIFTRFQPMLSPSLTRNYGRLRFFFVNLRQVEKETETVITGSKEGYYSSSFLSAKFEDIYERFDRISGQVHTSYTVEKGSFADIFFGIPAGTYSAANVRGKKSAPSAYWFDAYWKIFWDYYRDENLSTTYSDFSVFMTSLWTSGVIFKAPTSSYSASLFGVALRKGYLTAALPWQLKGVAPTLSAGVGSATFSGDFLDPLATSALTGAPNLKANVGNSITSVQPFGHDNYDMSGLVQDFNDKMNAALNNNTIGASFTMNMADLRAMAAQTRIFERMARCGSRYTEYLRSNFGVSPADETLQRPMYLGGMKFDVLVTEIEQTAQDGTNPVGTLRGHGIGNAKGGFSHFRAKEFGMLFAILDYAVDTQYTQGVDREFTYKSRTDFYNPSFQHLSEQEVRNAEVFYGNDTENDGVFGYQAMYNELRTGKQKIVGDMRGTLSYWQQGIDFSSRPQLNGAFISSFLKRASYRKPFVVQTLSTSTNPMIVDCFFKSDVYRPMARYGTAGLVDHL